MVKVLIVSEASEVRSWVSKELAHSKTFMSHLKGNKSKIFYFRCGRDIYNVSHPIILGGNQEK